MADDPRSLSQVVKAEALRLGFTLVGVTTPESPPHVDVFQKWLEQGRHGELDYLASEGAVARRADPRCILPECQSIVVLGIPYEPPPAPGTAGSKVAAYAWGEDYHDVLPARLEALVRFLEARQGHPIPNRYYTDTGPVLERDLAQRAGLGWIGKNTCLIHPRHGSYFLLAEILLGVALEPDQPFTVDHCGSCTRCLDACPTQCILPDRTLDARRCISYLTIELKGAISTGLRPALGEWVFGCDICQQVCPWNIRFARSTGEPAFAARPGLPSPDLSEILALDAQTFNARFKRSPLRRAKRRGFLRNVAVALGNRRDPAAVPALRRALLEDPEPLVRSHAAWALGQIATPEARQALQAADGQESDPAVCAEIASALAQG